MKRSGRDGKNWFFEFEASWPGFEVPAGGYFAFKVANSSVFNVELMTGESCGWIKPPNNPTYPTPELPPVILLGIGLLGLLGYLGWRRRKVISKACRNT